MNNDRTPEEIATATRVLNRDMPAGSPVSTLTVHVTSGGTPSVVVLVGKPDGSVEDLSWAVARVLGWKFDTRHGGVKVAGGNITHAFHLVNTLARTLYGNGDSLNWNRL